MADKMSGKGVKINTTEKIPTGGVLDSTLQAYEEWDMNKLNDPVDDLGKLSGPKQIKDKN